MKLSNEHKKQPESADYDLTTSAGRKAWNVAVAAWKKVAPKTSPLIQKSGWTGSAINRHD